MPHWTTFAPPRHYYILSLVIRHSLTNIVQKISDKKSLPYKKEMAARPAPDGGFWGWMAVVACFMGNLIGDGVMYRWNIALICILVLFKHIQFWNLSAKVQGIFPMWEWRGLNHKLHTDGSHVCFRYDRVGSSKMRRKTSPRFWIYFIANLSDLWFQYFFFAVLGYIIFGILFISSVVQPLKLIGNIEYKDWKSYWFDCKNSLKKVWNCFITKEHNTLFSKYGYFISNFLNFFHDIGHHNGKLAYLLWICNMYPNSS